MTHVHTALHTRRQFNYVYLSTRDVSTDYTLETTNDWVL